MPKITEKTKFYVKEKLDNGLIRARFFLPSPPSWICSDGKWIGGESYQAVVDKLNITITYKGSPDWQKKTKVIHQDKRAKADKYLKDKTAYFSPKLYLDGKEILPKSDWKIGESHNRLEMDYGICKHILQLRHGKILDWWVFEKNPEGDILIKSNLQKDTDIKTKKPFAINDFGKIDIETKDGNKYIPKKVFDSVVYPFFVDDTVDFYSSSSDGQIAKSNSSYSTAHDATTGSKYDTFTYFQVGQKLTTIYYVFRGFVFFDTSSIPSSATIQSASLNLYFYTDNSDTDFDIVIQNGQPTYPHDPLEEGDYYYDHYSGDGGSVNTSSLTLNTYNAITLNSTGLGWITKGGQTKLCLRSSRDINSNAPTGAEFIAFYSNEKGSGYQPYLEVTYSAGATNVTIVVPSEININLAINIPTISVVKSPTLDIPATDVDLDIYTLIFQLETAQYIPKVDTDVEIKTPYISVSGLTPAYFDTAQFDNSEFDVGYSCSLTTDAVIIEPIYISLFLNKISLYKALQTIADICLANFKIDENGDFWFYPKTTTNDTGVTIDEDNYISAQNLTNTDYSQVYNAVLLIGGNVLAYREDEFTGDGSTTVFKLSRTPTKDLLVTIDDVPQTGGMRGDDNCADVDYLYDRDTNEIYFCSAPANSSSIVVSYYHTVTLRYYAYDEDSVNLYGLREHEPIIEEQITKYEMLVYKGEWFLANYSSPKLQGSITVNMDLVGTVLHAGDTVTINLPRYRLNNEEVRIEQITYEITPTKVTATLTFIKRKDLAEFLGRVFDKLEQLRQAIELSNSSVLESDMNLSDTVTSTDDFSIVDNSPPYYWGTAYVDRNIVEDDNVYG